MDELKSDPEPEPKPQPQPTTQLRVRKPMSQSVINRVCTISSDMYKNSEAEVVYTNSQFGLKAIPCLKSPCRSCTLAPRKPRISVGKYKPKNGATKRNKRKRRIQALKAKHRAKKLANLRCVCVEINGRLLKLRDMPAEKVGAFLNWLKTTDT